MWMMGYNDHSMGGEFNVAADSFNGRRLRPLIPRPATAAAAASTSNTPTMNTTPCLGRIHGTSTDHHLLALNHHLMTTMSSEQNKKEYNLNSSITQQQQQQQQQIVVSSRWNPTPEQLHTLEELYQRGTRTPSADQIQHITTQLRRYGKIEGKNVFYWFQNHKARERQKRRRMLEYSSSDEQHLCDHLIERKESELSRTGFDVGQRKKWSTPSNCSNISEECVSMHRTVVAEGRTEGRTQFEEREFQQKSSLRAKHAVWQMMDDLPTTLTTEDEIRESQTLALFPLQSENRNVVHVAADDTTEVLPTAATININFTTPNQFFEFL